MGKKKIKRKTTADSQSNKKKDANAFPESIKNEKASGNSEYLRGNYEAAVEHYTRAIADCAGFPDVLVILLINRATTFIRLQAYQFVVDDSTNALLFGQNVRAFTCRAFGYFYTQQYAKSFADCDSVLKLVEKDVEFHRVMTTAREALSLQLKRIKDLAKMKKSLVRGTALEWIGDFGLLGIDEESLPRPPEDPNAPRAQRAVPAKRSADQMGVADSRMPPLIPVGDWMYDIPSCDDDAQIARTSNVQREEIASNEKNLGNREFDAFKYYAALGHYTKGIRFGQKDLYLFYSNRAMAYIKLGRFHEAITDCTMSIENTPSVKAYLRRGASWTAVGAHWRAIDDYKAVLSSEPGNAASIQGIEKTLKLCEDEIHEEMKGKPAPQRIEALKQLMVTISEERQNIEARKAAAPPPPVTPAAASTATKSAVDIQRLNSMIAKLSSQMKEENTNTLFYIQRSEVFVQLGQQDKARADLRSALRLDPDNQDFQRRYRLLKPLQSETAA